jgi:sulfur relay (sulfurtransferase) DsrF/TusC family protein
MKAVALVSNGIDNNTTQWQYDKIMSAIAYDLDLSVIFINKGLEQLNNNQSWRSLDLYGIDKVYYFSLDCLTIENPIFQVNKINKIELKELLKQTDVFI